MKPKLNIVILGRAIFVWLVTLSILFFASPELAAARPLFVISTVDDQPPNVSYLGSGWGHAGTYTNTFWNTLSASGVPGDTGDYGFTGSTITWFHSQASNRGTQDILIGGGPVLVNSTSFAPQTRRQIGTTFTVGNGPHTIRVKANGGGYTDIDAFASDIATVGSGVYDDSNAQLRPIGNFSSQTGTGAYQGTLHWSNVTGEGFRFSFLGDNITYAYSTAYNRGYATVTIDGVVKPDLNLYSGTTIRQQTTAYHSLGTGVHNLNVQVKGTPPPGSSGTFVDADALVIATTTRYMATTDNATLYYEGCAQGKQGQNGVVILDFGRPDQSGSSYGADIFDASLSFRSTDDIKLAAEAFLSGFYTCSPSTASIILGVGLNNLRSPSYANGQAWATMVSQISSWIKGPPGPDWSSKLSVRGGYDVEMQWQNAAISLPWADGFSSVTPRQYYYDFGSCDSCPNTSFPTWSPSAYGWSLDQIWQVSWNEPSAFPFPEIYNTVGIQASQWQWMSLYAYNSHGARMDISGALTQSQACIDSPPCAGTDNTPGTGWLSLYQQLNISPNTAQSLPSVSDITWHN